MVVLPENPNCARTYAAFRITGEFSDAAPITDAVGLIPTTVFPQGHQYPATPHGRGPRTQRIGVWALSSEPAVTSTDLERHLVYLLEAVEPATDRLLTLSSERGLRLDFFCYWASATGDGGPEISPSTLARMATLGASLGIDFYDASDDSDEDTDPSSGNARFGRDGTM